MDEFQISAPLAAALKAKGYESLTPVQEAVLADGVAGRDLLVSAKTGSGKTVAFGLAIAPDLLADTDKFLFADIPQALVIAPTRELALQVARELAWLYGEAEAKIATCVGGMDYRNERRSLERGAHIVVGTPGRLRDHIERGSLDLSGLRAVVLDEADEMLDLGFAEDLEFILAAAPETRRTLMFSATVPKEIAVLAKTFQRDALRIETAGEGTQHSDIEYRALSVQVRDREHAIFNLLRYYEARTAIVFCKTRANVNHLLARMGNRGFQVVALSGELSQQERSNALTALRSGRARVCIATDVAARGIDLPGLELVIHADLPSNPETLLHRSGRTGRAGSKGVSALVVTPSDFRKAQRILAAAKVTAEWGSAPSAEEVQARDDARIFEHPALQPIEGEDLEIANKILEHFGAETAAQAFVRLWREGRSAPEVLAEVAAPGAPKPVRERGEFGPSVWFTISVGHTARAEARWLLPKICDAGVITRDAIGAIRVQQNESFVQIAASEAAKFGDMMEIDREVTMRRMEGEPDLGRPAPRGERPARFERPERGERPARAPREDRGPREPREFGSRPERSERPAREDRAPRDDRAPYQRKPSRFPEDDARTARAYEPRKAPTERPDRSGWNPMSANEGRPAEAPAEGDRKARWKKDDRDTRPAKFEPRSGGFKSHGGGKADGDRPARSGGFKSHGNAPRSGFGEDRPWKKPSFENGEGKGGYARKGDSADGKPARSGGFKSAAPAGKGGFSRGPKPAGDARDTGKRFTPPTKGKPKF